MSRKPKNERQEDDKDLPGYPHYPENEDITRPENNTGKVNFTEENITLPEARDIPGQENVTPPPPGIMADTTISSIDEEELVSGDSLTKTEDEDDEVKIVMGTEADVTAEDLLLLSDEDDANIARGQLDELDEDGERLSENSDFDDMGSDLDVPGSESDDKNEKIGEEDEENNYYSLGSEDNDNITEGTP
ncbi:hypothetical protein [Polluticoccus soli]|uniref:hypothetical protein n=1 Tax=Polluticoccus soli TaxID=3034150 RepID=UPI0023E20113|nr:hypothetical protein [Flavipsychrobacter sp. JY13-12]